MPPKPPIRQGRLIFAWIKDRNGFAKLRPAAILTSDADLADSAAAIVAAVTTTFADPPPPFHVPVPWHPRGHPVTKLNRRSAVVANWLAEIEMNDIIGFGGDLPALTLRRVLEIVGDL